MELEIGKTQKRKPALRILSRKKKIMNVNGKYEETEETKVGKINNEPIFWSWRESARQFHIKGSNSFYLCVDISI